MPVLTLRSSKAKYPKWRGRTSKYEVLFDLRPLLDKWDVSFLSTIHCSKPHWYMFEKCERFSTKLEAIKFMMEKFDVSEVHLQDRYTKEFEIYTMEGITMINKAVENITLIYGTDSRFVSDAEVFNHIKRIETEMKSLAGISNKPKKLEQRLAELQGDIDKLVQVVDNR